MLANKPEGYGLISIIFHWVSGFTILGLFALGYWMVELTYYSAWYQDAPHIHKSVGLLLLALSFGRLLWRWFSKNPDALSHAKWEQKVASFTHLLLYLLMLSIMFSGILISTADGRNIWVFDWFEVPFPGELFNNQADVAGAIHKYAAYSLIVLVVLHAAGAIKHHVVDKDATLRRMLKPVSND